MENLYNIQEKNGFHNVQSCVDVIYTYNATTKYFLFHWSEISHNSHQKDNAPVRHVCKICTKISYQSCKYIYCEKLTATYQKENFTPRKERICHYQQNKTGNHHKTGYSKDPNIACKESQY